MKALLAIMAVWLISVAMHDTFSSYVETPESNSYVSYEETSEYNSYADLLNYDSYEEMLAIEASDEDIYLEWSEVIDALEDNNYVETSEYSNDMETPEIEAFDAIYEGEIPEIEMLEAEYDAGALDLDASEYNYVDLNVPESSDDEVFEYESQEYETPEPELELNEELDEGDEESSVTLFQQAQVAITMEANPESGTEVESGSEIVYTVTVTNIGDTVARNIVVLEESSRYLDPQDARISAHFNNDVAQPISNGIDRARFSIQSSTLSVNDRRIQTLSWEIESLDPGESLTVIIPTIVGDNVPTGTAISNIARIHALLNFELEGIIISSNRLQHNVGEVEEVDQLPPTTDKKSNENEYKEIGDNVQFTLTTNNPNDFDIFDVLVVESIPDHLTFVEGSIRVQRRIEPLMLQLNSTGIYVDVTDVVAGYVGGEIQALFSTLPPGNTYITFDTTVERLPDDERNQQRPPTQQRPPSGQQRPPGARPPGERPPGARPPGARPPGAQSARPQQRTTPSAGVQQPPELQLPVEIQQATDVTQPEATTQPISVTQPAVEQQSEVTALPQTGAEQLTSTLALGGTALLAAGLLFVSRKRRAQGQSPKELQVDEPSPENPEQVEL